MATATEVPPTVAPTATATPAPTPTRTPYPTSTPAPISISCDDSLLIGKIVDLSQDSRNPFAPRILKTHTGARELERTTSALRCEGEALLSSGEEHLIEYYLRIDRDGDEFVGYEILESIATPTQVPTPHVVATQPAQPTPTVTAQPTQPTPIVIPLRPKQYDSPPAMAIDTAKRYAATIELEKGGEIVIELYADKAPVTVNSFVFLAREGFYDGVTFHRVIPGFMAQTGDPTGTGTGGPGYHFDNEFHPDVRHDSPGVVSMANAGLRNGRGTNGSQIFITFVPVPFLDGLNPDGSEKNCAAESCHAVFGKVVEGMDVLLGISERDPLTARTPGDAIKTITIAINLVPSSTPTPIPTPVPIGHSRMDPAPAGTTVVTHDGLGVTIVGAERDDLLYIRVRVQNIAGPDNQELSLSKVDFRLTGSSATIIQPYTELFTDCYGRFPNDRFVSLLKGGATEGVVCFDVPETEPGLTLFYEPRPVGPFATPAVANRRWMQVSQPDKVEPLRDVAATYEPAPEGLSPINPAPPGTTVRTHDGFDVSVISHVKNATTHVAGGKSLCRTSAQG